MNKERYEQIKEHFENISTEEFYQNLVDCGYFKSVKGSIFFRCDNYECRQKLISRFAGSGHFCREIVIEERYYIHVRLIEKDKVVSVEKELISDE